MSIQVQCTNELYKAQWMLAVVVTKDYHTAEPDLIVGESDGEES